MIYLKTFENQTHQNKILIIVDVQKSFRKFFSEMYLNKLKKYCESFQTVYQIFDNHVDGSNIDKDYLYDDDHEISIHDDLYEFPNQKDIIEKRYNYNINVDFYKKILSVKDLKKIKELETSGKLKIGDLFKTKEDTYIIFIGNKHRWLHLPKKLINIFQSLKGKEVTFVGGADAECLTDIFISAESLGVKAKRDHRYIYSATHCPIK